MIHSFPGFKASDFGTTDGTHWRGREIIDRIGGHRRRRHNPRSLGNIVAAELRRQRHREYRSWTPARYMAIHYGIVNHYRFGFESSHRYAKLAFYLKYDEEEPVKIGFVCEKPHQQLRPDYHWVRFLSMLSDDKGFREKLTNVASSLSLSTEAYIVSKGDVKRWSEFRAREVVAFLSAIPADQWCDFFLCRNLDKGSVLDMGPAIVNEIMQVFDGLSRVYEMFLGI